MSSYGKRCKRPTVFPACGPRCEAVLPKFHDCVYSSLWFLLFFFERSCCSKKEANSLHSGLIANGRARRQGRRGEPFIGAERKPLTEQARDRAQPLAEKGICRRTVLIAGVNYRSCFEGFAWVLTCRTYPSVRPAVGDPVLQ